MSLDNISKEEWKVAAKQHNMTVEELKKAVEEHASQEESHSCGCGSNEGENHQHHHQIRAFEDFTEDELIEGAEYNKMELEEFKEFKEALKLHLKELEEQEKNGHHQAKQSIEDFTEEELIEGAKANEMELEEFKIALVEYLANQNNGCGCGGHDDDHECCGGHNHDDGECCSNH